MTQADTTGSIIAWIVTLDPGPCPGSWNHWCSLSENQYCGTHFVSREHNLIRDVYADTRRGEPGGVWLYVCMYLCIYICYFMYYLFPVQWYTHSLFQDSSVSSFSQRFSPRNPLDFTHLPSTFKCTVIQSPQDSAKKWALLLSTLCFIHENSIWDDRLLRSIVL